MYVKQELDFSIKNTKTIGFVQKAMPNFYVYTSFIALMYVAKPFVTQ